MPDANGGDSDGASQPDFNPNNPNNFAVEASYLLIPGAVIVVVAGK